MIKAKMEADGWVVIPLEIREKLGLEEGDTVLWELLGDEARLTTPSARIRWARASIREIVPEGVSLADELIAERRAEAEGE